MIESFRLDKKWTFLCSQMHGPAKTDKISLLRQDRTELAALEALKMLLSAPVRAQRRQRKHIAFGNIMTFKSCLLLLVLGWCSVRSETGDFTMSDWFQSKLDLILKFEERLNNVDKCCKDLEQLELKLNATLAELTRQKEDIDKLKEENKELKKIAGKAAPQIAFSVSLTDSEEVYKGPSTDTTLVFKRVFSNVGNAYDSNTGIFTAPQGGSYFFTFNTYGYNTHTAGAILVKNGELQVSTYEATSFDGADSNSNSVVLTLAPGDTVHVQIWDNGRVFDNANGHTTFSGFLLFPTSA